MSWVPRRRMSGGPGDKARRAEVGQRNGSYFVARAICREVKTAVPLPEAVRQPPQGGRWAAREPPGSRGNRREEQLRLFDTIFYVYKDY